MSKQRDNSFAVSTNVQWGSTFLPEIWENSQSFLIPNISLNHPKIGGRSGAQINMQADSVTYSPLIIDIIIDSEFVVYETIYENFINMLNVETGKFAQDPFEMWLSILDHKEEEKAKWTYHNCRVTDISEMNVDTISDDVNLIVTLTIDFDYLSFKKI